MISELEHRNFVLNLSTQMAQYLAAGEDFLVPSTDVQWMENIDVLKNWKYIEGTHVLPYISRAAKWMISVTFQPHWTAEHQVMMYQAYCSMMVSNLLMLKNAGMLQFAHEPDISIGIWDTDNEEYTQIDPLDYSYKDEIGHLDWEPDLSDDGEETTE